MRRRRRRCAATTRARLAGQAGHEADRRAAVDDVDEARSTSCSMSASAEALDNASIMRRSPVHRFTGSPASPSPSSPSSSAAPCAAACVRRRGTAGRRRCSATARGRRRAPRSASIRRWPQLRERALDGPIEVREQAGDDLRPQVRLRLSRERGLLRRGQLFAARVGEQAIEAAGRMPRMEADRSRAAGRGPDVDPAREQAASSAAPLATAAVNAPRAAAAAEYREAPLAARLQECQPYRVNRRPRQRLSVRAIRSAGNSSRPRAA